MTIIRDGEKWACKQCIAGHRVSTCTHEERPLHHVARKGRPVSQCVHCRGLRKARAQHVKCDCGERRLSSASHSRNNSSESASTTADENTCLCYQGKKCTCALKKEPGTFEPNLTVPRSGLAPFLDRDTGKPHIPNRRSEHSVPRSRNTYQPGLQRTGYSPQEARRPYQNLSSPLARGYHAAQRSVDSLPLFLNNTGPTPGQTAFPPTAFHQDNPFMQPEPRYLSPNSHQTHLATANLPEVPSFGDFNVEPLGETVLERTLSPRNPNRHSISGTISGQWAALMDNSDLQKLGEQANFEQIYGGGQANETQGYSFPSQHTQQWPGNWGISSEQQQLPQQSHLCSRELAGHGQFSHSRSSSGTVSEPLDPPSYNNSNHPTIQIDPSPTWEMGPDEKIWSAAYSDVPPDFNFSGDATLPHYSDEFSVTDQPEYDYAHYSYPAPHESDSRNNSVDSISVPQGLPDRSVQTVSYNVASTGLPQYKFPPEPTQATHGDEMYQNHQTQHYDWQQSGHDAYIKEEGGNSPWNGYG